MAETERSHYKELMTLIDWFFFDLFILGYVEDPESGLSFCLPEGLAWSVYIEVLILPHFYLAKYNIMFLIYVCT